jgi:hypothetical protein
MTPRCVDSSVPLAWLRLCTLVAQVRVLGAFTGSLTVRPVKPTMSRGRNRVSTPRLPSGNSAPADFYRGHMWPTDFCFSYLLSIS